MIDSREEYEAIRDLFSDFLLSKPPASTFMTKRSSLFDYLGVEQEIARAMSRKVWLKSGGHLVIDHTEAMTVIDVNTGRFVGKRDQEETILRNNLEAAQGNCVSSQVARDRRDYHRGFHRYGTGKKSRQGLSCVSGCHGVR